MKVVSVTLALAGVFFAAALPAATADSIAADSTLRFDVYLDDREIGYHRFDIDRVGDAVRVASEANFEVRFLFFTAFDYQHDNTELWRDGCLESIDARTLSNGRQFDVTGRAGDDRFVLETGDRDTALDACVRSFAYWDRALLDKPKLLNSQTGELLDVTLQKIDPGTVRIDGNEIPVDRYALSAQGMDITLAYAADSGQWLALDSVVKGGRMLRYRRSNVEAPFGRQASADSPRGSVARQ